MDDVSTSEALYKAIIELVEAKVSEAVAHLNSAADDEEGGAAGFGSNQYRATIFIPSVTCCSHSA